MSGHQRPAITEIQTATLDRHQRRTPIVYLLRPNKLELTAGTSRRVAKALSCPRINPSRPHFEQQL